MTKKEKRLQKIRRNPREVTFDELVSVLEDQGFNFRKGRGSHYFSDAQIGDRVWTVTIVKPHGDQKYIHPKAVKRILKYIDEMRSEGE